MFTVLADKVANAHACDVGDPHVDDRMVTHVGVVSSGQFRATIPLQDLISERVTPGIQPFNLVLPGDRRVGEVLAI